MVNLEPRVVHYITHKNLIEADMDEHLKPECGEEVPPMELSVSSNWGSVGCPACIRMFCKVCGIKITMMSMIGTGFCCPNHQRGRTGGVPDSLMRSNGDLEKNQAIPKAD